MVKLASCSKKWNFFRYENKKRMFKPDDLEPKYKPRPVQQQRPIQEHRPKPRVYQGNGVSFEVSQNYTQILRYLISPWPSLPNLTSVDSLHTTQIVVVFPKTTWDSNPIVGTRCTCISTPLRLNLGMDQKQETSAETNWRDWKRGWKTKGQRSQGTHGRGQF